MKGESGSIVTNKLNKLKSKMLMKRGDKLKQKAADSSASAMSKRFSSNGSLLSQNGLKAAYSAPDLNSNAAAAAAAAAAVSATGEDGGGGGDVTAVAAAASGGDEGDYVHMVEGEFLCSYPNVDNFPLLQCASYFCSILHRMCVLHAMPERQGVCRSHLTSLLTYLFVFVRLPELLWEPETSAHLRFILVPAC